MILCCDAMWMIISWYVIWFFIHQAELTIDRTGCVYRMWFGTRLKYRTLAHTIASLKFLDFPLYP